MEYLSDRDAVAAGWLNEEQLTVAAHALENPKPGFQSDVAEKYRANGYTMSKRQWQAMAGMLRRRRKAGAPVKQDDNGRAVPVSADDLIAANNVLADGTLDDSFTNNRRKLSPAQRIKLRKAVTSNGAWKGYRKAHGIDSSTLSGDVLWDALDALGIDADAVLRADLDKAFADIGKSVSDGGAVDWQRVRRIAREEVERRLDPIVKTRVVIDQGKAAPVALYDDDKGFIPHPGMSALVTAVNCVDFSKRYLIAYLVGPTGTGKSYACEKLAEQLGLEFRFQSVAMEPHDLVGYERVNGTLKVTQFVEAFRDGHLVLLDELDRWEPKAVVALNAALANGRIALDDGSIIKQHPNFRCVAAGNTGGLGADSDFTAAEKQDLSTLSRLAVRIKWDAVREIEMAIAQAQGGDVAAAWCHEVLAAREVMERLDMPRLADQRCIEAGAGLLANGLDPETVRGLTYLSPCLLDVDQIDAIKGAMLARDMVTVA